MVKEEKYIELKCPKCLGINGVREDIYYNYALLSNDEMACNMCNRFSKINDWTQVGDGDE